MSCLKVLRSIAFAAAAAASACSSNSANMPATDASEVVANASPSAYNVEEPQHKFDIMQRITSTLAGSFGLVIGDTHTTASADVSLQGYKGPFSFTGGGANLKISCKPASCKPVIDGAVVGATITPMKKWAGTLTISASTGAKLELPYRITPISVFDNVGAIGSTGGCRGGDGNLRYIDESTTPPQFDAVTTSGTVAHSYPIPAAYSITSCAPGKNGSIWFTFLPGLSSLPEIGVLTLDGKVRIYEDTGIPNPYPMSIVTGPDGNMWFTDGNQQFAQGTYIVRVTPRGSMSYVRIPSSCSLRGLSPGNDSALWVAACDVGFSISRLYRIATHGNMTSFEISGGLGSASLTAGPDGKMWFMQGSNMCEVSATSNVTCGKALTQVSSNLVLGNDGGVWALDSGDLVRFQSLNAYTRYHGVPDLAYNPVLTGVDGSVWIGGSKGLSVIHP